MYVGFGVISELLKRCFGDALFAYASNLPRVTWSIIQLNQPYEVELFASICSRTGLPIHTQDGQLSAPLSQAAVLLCT